jgi:hypothetical protein
MNEKMVIPVLAFFELLVALSFSLAACAFRRCRIKRIRRRILWPSRKTARLTAVYEGQTNPVSACN